MSLTISRFHCSSVTGFSATKGVFADVQFLSVKNKRFARCRGGGVAVGSKGRFDKQATIVTSLDVPPTPLFLIAQIQIIYPQNKI